MNNTNLKSTETVRDITTLLIDYLQSKSKKSRNIPLDILNTVPLFYINVLTNREAKWFKDSGDPRISYTDMLKRDAHNFCNITYIDYVEDANGYKSFGERKYAYVMNQNADTIFSLRKDLIDNWAERNAKDSVIIINTINGNVYDIEMQDILRWYNTRDNGMKFSMNEQGNVIVTFSLPKEEEYQHYDLEDSKNYLEQSWQYIGACNYARYRRGTVLLAAQYNEDGTLKGKNIFKSLKQIYTEVGFTNIGSYKTFQRLFKTETVAAMFLTSDSGKVYFISTDIYITVPEHTDEIESGIVETDIMYSDATCREDISVVLDNRKNITDTDKINEMVESTLNETANVIQTKIETSDFIKFQQWEGDWPSYKDYLYTRKRIMAEEVEKGFDWLVIPEIDTTEPELPDNEYFDEKEKETVDFIFSLKNKVKSFLQSLQ